MIEVDALGKQFGAVRALDGVSFAAADGKITGLLGPNGAGKSTCLRILSTVLAPDQGRARIGGMAQSAIGPSGRGGGQRGMMMPCAPATAGRTMTARSRRARIRFGLLTYMRRQPKPDLHIA